MKKRLLTLLALAAALLLPAAVPAAIPAPPACSGAAITPTQANIENAISAAGSNVVICLLPGTVSGFNIAAYDKTNVTVRSSDITDRTVFNGIELDGTRGITFSYLRINQDIESGTPRYKAAVSVHQRSSGPTDTARLIFDNNEMYSSGATAYSSTSNNVTAGTKTFTILPGIMGFQPKNWITIYRVSAPDTTNLIGYITAYSDTTLTVEVTQVNGTGTGVTDWFAYVDGGTVTTNAATDLKVTNNYMHDAQGAHVINSNVVTLAHNFGTDLYRQDFLQIQNSNDVTVKSNSLTNAFFTAPAEHFDYIQLTDGGNPFTTNNIWVMDNIYRKGIGSDEGVQGLFLATDTATPAPKPGVLILRNKLYGAQNNGIACADCQPLAGVGGIIAGNVVQGYTGHLSEMNWERATNILITGNSSSGGATSPQAGYQAIGSGNVGVTFTGNVTLSPCTPGVAPCSPK